jgi:hypothetical protein
MFGERLSNPAILAFVCAKKDDEVVARCIVRVKEVRHDAQKADASCDDEKLIFAPELVEDLLLVLLGIVSERPESEGAVLARGKDSLTGALSSPGMDGEHGSEVYKSCTSHYCSRLTKAISQVLATKGAFRERLTHAPDLNFYNLFRHP